MIYFIAMFRAGFRYDVSAFLPLDAFFAFRQPCYAFRHADDAADFLFAMMPRRCQDADIAADTPPPRYAIPPFRHDYRHAATPSPAATSFSRFFRRFAFYFRH